jgi:hypothetical protein
MSGFSNLFTLRGECQPLGWTSPPNPRQSSTKMTTCPGQRWIKETTHPPQMTLDILGIQEGVCSSTYPRGKTHLRSEAVGQFKHHRQAYHHNGGNSGKLVLNLPQGENPFTFGGSGTLQAPPAGLPPQWGEPREASPTHPQTGIPGTVTHGPPQPQAAQAGPTAPYPGMTAAIKKWGIGDTVMQNVEL